MQSFKYFPMLINTLYKVSLCQHDILAIVSLPILQISKNEYLVLIADLVLSMFRV